MQKESAFEKKVVADLKRLPNCYGFKVQQVVIRGTPDRLYCINRVFVALELKRSSKAARSALQIYNINEIERAGGYARFVWPSIWPEVYEELKDIANGRKHEETKQSNQA